MQPTARKIAPPLDPAGGEGKQLQAAGAAKAPERSQPVSLTPLPVSREFVKHCADTQAGLEEEQARASRRAGVATRSLQGQDRKYALVAFTALAVVGFTSALLLNMPGPLESTDPQREAAVIGRHSEYAAAEKYALTQQIIPASEITSRFIAAGAVVRLFEPSSTVVSTGVAILLLVGSAYLCLHRDDLVRAFAKPKAD